MGRAGCLRVAPRAGLIGQNGFSDHHREGDGTTPTGIYRLGPVVYGNDPNPGFHGRYHRLVCGDWWDEDPTSPGYNTFDHTPCGESPPFGGDSEALWTETNYYPSFAVVEYNVHPVVPFAGLAIFVHAIRVGNDGLCEYPVTRARQVPQVDGHGPVADHCDGAEQRTGTVLSGTV